METYSILCTFLCWMACAGGQVQMFPSDRMYVSICVSMVHVCVCVYTG